MGKLDVIIKVVCDGFVKIMKAIRCHCKSDCCKCDSSCNKVPVTIEDAATKLEGGAYNIHSCAL